MTLDEIVANVHSVHKATIHLYSGLNWREDGHTFGCIIKRKSEGDNIEINRDSTESLQAAAEAAWSAFSRLVTRGYEAGELMPTLLAAPSESE